MRLLGLVLVIVGILGGVFAFNLDTTLATGGETIGSGMFSITVPEGRVHNLGLIQDRNNYLHVSGLAILVGVMLFGFGTLKQTLEASTPTGIRTPVLKNSEQITEDLVKKLVAGHKLQPEQISLLVDAATADNKIIHVSSPRNGNTLLHLAAEANLLEECKKLIALGAKTDLGDGNGRLAYQLATHHELSLLLKNLKSID